MFKYSNKVTIIGNNIKMNGEGVKFVVVEGELWDISDLISDMQSELSAITDHAYDISFYFDYYGLNIDYNLDIVPNKDIDKINNFIFLSDIDIINY